MDVNDSMDYSDLIDDLDNELNGECDSPGSDCQVKDIVEEIDYTKIPPQAFLERLSRRGQLLTEIRNAYLRDVIALKHLLEELLTGDERASILNQWKSSVPSLDLRQHFMLYSPGETSMDVLPCNTCGGSVEVVHHDSSEIEELSKALSHMDKNKEELRVIIATKNNQLEFAERQLEEFKVKYKDEKRVLYNQMKELRAESASLISQNEHLQSMNQTLRAENIEFKLVTKDTAVLRDVLVKTETENNTLKVELKQVEESLIDARKQIRLQADKINNLAESCSSLSNQVAELTPELELARELTLKHKESSDSFQKRNAKLQFLLESSRREVESLQVTTVVFIVTMTDYGAQPCRE